VNTGYYYFTKIIKNIFKFFFIIFFYYFIILFYYFILFIFIFRVETFSRCGHQFHHKCIEVWLKKKNVCPICRKEDPRNDKKKDTKNKKSENSSSDDLLFDDFTFHPAPLTRENISFMEDRSYFYDDTMVCYNTIGSSGGSSDYGGGSCDGGGGGGGSW
jgi:hypothetical protein